MRIQEVVVVEGRHDTARVRETVGADTIETGGSAVDDTVIKQIRHAQAKRGVIILTDPDFPGKRIRHIISQAVPDCKHAFLPREAGRNSHSNRTSLGIEHASAAAIRDALQSVYSIAEEEQADITRQDLVNAGLIGSSKAGSRRDRLGEILKIGHTNGKQLLKRLTMFRISKEQFDTAMQQVMREESYDS